MNRLQLTTAIAVAAVSLTFAARVGRAADAEKPAAPIGSSLDLSRFYSGPVGHQGMFHGKLLCLCCDLAPDTGKPKTCDANGHHHVLAVADDGMLHPLLAGTEDAMQQINSNELHGKQVVVTGNYYPATGFIFVNAVRPE